MGLIPVGDGLWYVAVGGCLPPTTSTVYTYFQFYGTEKLAHNQKGWEGLNCGYSAEEPSSKAHLNSERVAQSPESVH